VHKRGEVRCQEHFYAEPIVEGSRRFVEKTDLMAIKNENKTFAMYLLTPRLYSPQHPKKKILWRI